MWIDNLKAEESKREEGKITINDNVVRTVSAQKSVGVENANNIVRAVSAQKPFEDENAYSVVRDIIVFEGKEEKTLKVGTNLLVSNTVISSNSSSQVSKGSSERNNSNDGGYNGSSLTVESFAPLMQEEILFEESETSFEGRDANNVEEKRTCCKCNSLSRNGNSHNIKWKFDDNQFCKDCYQKKFKQLVGASEAAAKQKGASPKSSHSSSSTYSSFMPSASELAAKKEEEGKKKEDEKKKDTDEKTVPSAASPNAKTVVKKKIKTELTANEKISAIKDEMFPEGFYAEISSKGFVVIIPEMEKFLFGSTIKVVFDFSQITSKVDKLYNYFTQTFEPKVKKLCASALKDKFLYDSFNELEISVSGKKKGSLEDRVDELYRTCFGG